MSYPHRVVLEGATYHVMNRGAGHRQVFSDDADRVEFGRLLGVAHDRFGIQLDAYCLMGNHYHLLVHCPAGQLSEAMQYVSSVYTRHFNERVGRDGPLFRSRFRSLPVDTDEYLLHAVRYIHRNPLDVAGVDQVDRYRWSSHRTYLGHRRSPRFLTTSRVLGYFGGDASAFDRFVRSEPGARERFDLRTLQSVVWLAVGHVDGNGRGGASFERTILLLLADHLADDDRRRLLDDMGIPSAAAGHSAVSRARRRCRESHEIRRALAFALRELGLGWKAA